MAEKRRTTSLSPNSLNKSSELTPVRFTTLSVPQDTKEDMRPLSSKRPRGRPLGSKNKPKPPVFIREDNDTIMKPILIEILDGIDIVETLIDLALHHHAGILVLSGSGIVSDVTLCHPISCAPTFPIQGAFNIISLSGSYVVANCGCVPPRSSFCIYLSGDQGQIFGGVIGGKVIAASRVVVTASLFKKYEFHEVAFMNESKAEENDLRYGGGVILNADRAATEPNNNNTTIGSGFGVAGGNSISYGSGVVINADCVATEPNNNTANGFGFGVAGGNSIAYGSGVIINADCVATEPNNNTAIGSGFGVAGENSIMYGSGVIINADRFAIEPNNNTAIEFGFGVAGGNSIPYGSGVIINADHVTTEPNNNTVIGSGFGVAGGNSIMYGSGVIINDDCVVTEPNNNTAIGSGFGVVGGNSTPYGTGVIINADRVATEPNNNTAIGSGFGVVGGNSIPFNFQLPLPPPTDMNFMQWNHSNSIDNY